MVAEAERSTEPRAPLSKERALRAAVRVADSEGVDALSMRRLARELGVGAMSLYYHLANKDELLDGMVDLVFGDVDLPATDDDWKPAMRQRALSARSVLAHHPWAIALMESRMHPGPANVRHHEAVLASLRRSGFSIAAATHAYWILDSYIYGFALQEASLPFHTSEELAEMSEQVFLPQLPPDEYPYLHEAATALAEAGYDLADEFRVGLDLILHALERLRDTSGRRA